MPKWINTATGQQVPDAEVSELPAGSGIFVHTTTKDVPVAVPKEATRPAAVSDYEVVVQTTKFVDGYCVRIGDAETYNPAVHTVAGQVLESQTKLRSRAGV